MTAYLLISFVGALGAIAAAVRELRRVSLSNLGDPSVVLQWMQSPDYSLVRLEELASDEPAAELVVDALRQKSRAECVAFINVEIRAVDGVLGRARTVPWTLLRISLATGTAAAVLAFSETLVSSSRDPVPAIACFGVGGLGAAVVGEVGRRARARARALAGDYDRLVSRVLRLAGDVPMGSGGLPGSKR